MPTRQRSHHRKTRPVDTIDTTNLLLGAAAVGLVGVAAAVLFAPKEHDFMDDVKDSYGDIQDKACDFLNGFAKKSKGAMSSARDGIRETSSHYLGYPEKESCMTRNLAIGALAGVIIGTAGYVLMATKSGKGFQADLKHGYNDVTKKTNLFANVIKDLSESATDNFKSIDWVNVASELVDALSNKAKNFADEVQHQAEDEIESDSKLGKLFNLGLMGLRLYQNLNSRR